MGQCLGESGRNTQICVVVSNSGSDAYPALAPLTVNHLHCKTPTDVRIDATQTPARVAVGEVAHH